jgi:hypothetical protein
MENECAENEGRRFSLDEWGQRLSWGGESICFDHTSDFEPEKELHYLGLWAKLWPRPDSVSAGNSSSGRVAVACRKRWPDLGEEVVIEEALVPVVATILVDFLHEVAEHLRVEGELIFKAHGDENADAAVWELLTVIGDQAARAMVSLHPRRSSEQIVDASDQFGEGGVPVYNEAESSLPLG